MPNAPTCIWRENLDAELKAIGLPIREKLPKANASHRVAWPQSFKLGGLLEMIKPWADPDFELGGYEWPQASDSQRS